MNEGLVIIAGWVQWLLVVALLVVTVVRRVDDVHSGDRSLAYRRKRPASASESAPPVADE